MQKMLHARTLRMYAVGTMETLLPVTATTHNASFQHAGNLWMLTFSVLQLRVSRSFCGLHLLSGIVS